MSVSFVSSSHVAPAQPTRGSAWESVKPLALDGQAGWVLRRNCSVTPRQMGAFYLSLCVASLVIGVFFAMQGAAFVLAFAGVELLAVGVALLIHARHCADREVVSLRRGRLEIEVTRGAAVTHESFDAAFVRVECEPGALVRVSCHGRSVLLGRHLRSHLREPLARELRRALREAATPQVASSHD